MTTAAELVAAAAAVRAHAYAPYSGYAVGAAIRSASGRVFAACNVENAAYPQGQCAEANAIGMMVAAGERAITDFALVGGGELLCTPCGGCRQRLVEFGRPETRIYLAVPEGLRETTTLGALLPMAFGPINLGGAVSAAGEDAASVIRRRSGGLQPLVAIVLGSGLGAIAERIADPVAVTYDELPGFPRPSVQGHAGRLVLGRLAGVPVACLSGRAHLYEGVGPRPLNTLVRTLKAIGCRAILLSNASGSLRPELGAGSLVLIEDHINLQGTNPLVGPNDEAVGPRFVDLTEVYAQRLRAAIGAAAAASGIALARGIYLAVLGPSFETPAEIRAYRALGADLVGMSTVPEAISARHAGLEVAAISVVTNLAAGLAAEPLTHAETLSQSAAAVGRVGDLLEVAMPEIARALA
jgi:homotetrameric cytidine deaminase